MPGLFLNVTGIITSFPAVAFTVPISTEKSVVGFTEEVVVEVVVVIGVPRSIPPETIFAEVLS